MSLIAASPYERVALIRAINSPLCHEDYTNAGITEDHFAPDTYAPIWRAIGEAIAEHGQSYDSTQLECTLQRLKLDHLITEARAIAEENSGISEDSDVIAHLITRRTLRELAPKLADVQKQLTTRGLAALPDFLESFDAIRRKVETLENPREQAALRLLRENELRPESPIPLPEPVLACNGVVICTRGNLSALVAPPKSGKSAAVTAIAAACIVRNPIEALGFEGRSSRDGCILIFDTEQAKGHAWRNMQLVLRRAGRNDTADRLRMFSLAGHEAPKVRESVIAGVRQAAKRGPVDLVVIDGAADLALDVNDPEECNSLVAQLQLLAIQTDCAILSILHLNPGQAGKDAKSRGHLGSQLERKCESNLRLEQDPEADCLVLYGDHRQRGAPLKKEQGARFRWSDEAKMHMGCQVVGKTRQEAAKADAEDDLRRIAADLFAAKPSMRYMELKKSYTELTGKSDSSATRIVNQLISKGIVSNYQGNYSIKSV